VAPNFIFKFFSLNSHIFEIFSKLLFQNFVSKYFFPMIPPKFIIYYFLVFYKFLTYEFHFSIKLLCRSFVFEHNCTSKFIMIFLHVYVLCIILYLNKLYNF
jgi:hypothetical protein